jgi:hypothetical protein
MKACARNRKQLALLGANALDAGEEQALRLHVQSCDGCREYLHEICAVTENLKTTERTDIQTSEVFHQRIVRRVKAEQATSFLETATALFAPFRLRLALLSLVVIFLIAAFFAFNRKLPIVATSTPQIVRTASSQKIKRDPEPTVANYQMIAKGSLDSLDELLTRQGIHNSSGTPTYRASLLSSGYDEPEAPKK